MHAQLGTLQNEVPEAPAERPEDHDEAERNLWSWYLEWSGIARVAITDRRLLRMLGFLGVNRTSDRSLVEEDIVDEEEDIDEPDEEDVEPVEPEPADPTHPDPQV